MRVTAVPTCEQMLILADRAERGPLTAAEASRLRAGIRAADQARRSATGRTIIATRETQQQARRVAAVRDLVGRARSRGARTVAVWALSQAVEPGQRPPVATKEMAR